MIKYIRFWFEFDIENAFDYPPGIGSGCGVTALNYEDALKLIDDKIFNVSKRPPLKRVLEDVDIRDLDQGHVIPNMAPPVYHGIWFPLGYQDSNI